MASSNRFESSPHLYSVMPEERLSTKIDYRKDIDSLRAIAVLLVIFYHLFGSQSLFANGFIGVDIFFVLSGYLISHGIVSELKRNTFSFKSFYLKRIKRILPAFLFVVSVVTLVGYFLLVPDDLKKLFESALASCLSVSNLYFWKHTSISYFHEDASLLPLLHTWSLGVEEQFYLLWPLIVFFLFQRYPRFLGPVTLSLAFLSIFIYLCTINHPNFIFYSSITRGFELLVGSSLAIYWKQLKTPPRTQSCLLSLIGLSLIFYLSSYLNPFQPLLISQILICIATALLIYAGKNLDNTMLKLLTISPLAFLFTLFVALAYHRFCPLYRF
jgi:peptidoglycan/LPS O-acetylase OafA/YrhL